MHRGNKINSIYPNIFKDYWRSYSNSVVKIGDVSIKMRPRRATGYVPIKYMPLKRDSVPPKALSDLRWMMQKDILGQDIFLIGRPGPQRRRLAMQYLELIGAEVEYVSLSRDTTESDLKQRREIVSGTARYINQSAVRAAIEGRFLVLDGIEKAERNVLPVLNNLLENREMHLEDGKLLISPSRYDSLLKDYSKDELDEWNLVRVSNDFRVIALGLPVPAYTGHPLDPPLRSRFQARDVKQLSYEEYQSALNTKSDRFSQILSFAHTLMTDEASAVGFPEFPLENIDVLQAIYVNMPTLNPYNLVNYLYPYKTFLSPDSIGYIEDALNTFNINKCTKKMNVNNVAVKEESKGQVSINGITLPVPVGSFLAKSTDDFVSIQYHENVLANMAITHSVGDFCLIGPKGCGKSQLVKNFANIFGYETETIMLYQDMTARDILQQRSTLSNGDTVWKFSPLVNAALEGKISVLDGVHRIHRGSLGILQRLTQDREVQLHDGTRLLRSDRFDTLLEEIGSKAMEDLGLRRIHPSFRIIALAENPSPENQWLCPEMLSSFLFHEMKPLNYEEEVRVVEKLTGKLNPNTREVLKFTHRLKLMEDASLKSIAASMSTRQILRIAKRMNKFENESVFRAIEKSCMSEFLPILPKGGLHNLMRDENILAPEESSQKTVCQIKEGTLTIGTTSCSIHNPDTKSKVPDTLFYETNQNIRVMENLLQDFVLGEHLLLVGNQGVGKNKYIDRLLSLLSRPREYIQLHRDTTVQSLTLTPSVKGGVIVYEDSPLVKAVKSGNVLVIDEADKAPIQVTCILKTLIETGEMILSDGRRISKKPGQGNILLHPDFRTIVLANRPGFPFLGNDFFGSMGDLFSCHAIVNPTMEAEMSMLRQYGPSVPEETLFKFVSIFSELRDLADEGSIQYPYSTRELVNIVKHLEQFPNDGLSSVIRNVFDFDSYEKETMESLEYILQKHGIPMNEKSKRIRLSPEFPLPFKRKLVGSWSVNSSKQFSVEVSPTRSLSQKGPYSISPHEMPLDIVVESRGLGFTEMESYRVLSYHEQSMTVDAVVEKDPLNPALNDILHVLTKNPFCLYTVDLGNRKNYFRRNLHQFFSQKHSHLDRSVMNTLVDGKLVVHNESDSDIILVVDVISNRVFKVPLSNFLDSVKGTLNYSKSGEQRKRRMVKMACKDSPLSFYYPGDNFLDLVYGVSTENPSLSNLKFPFNVRSVHPLRGGRLFICAEGDSYFLFEKKLNDESLILEKVELSSDTVLGGIRFADSVGFNDEKILEKVMGHKVNCPNSLLSTSRSYALLMMGFPDLKYSESNEIFDWPRDHGDCASSRDSYIFLPKSGLLVSQVLPNRLPSHYLLENQPADDCLGYLEVVNIPDEKVRYIPVPDSISASMAVNWFRRSYPGEELHLCQTSNDGLLSVDLTGTIRLWEVSLANLQRSLNDWKNMIGVKNERNLMIEKNEVGEMDSPKHGKVDSKNQPHVGGNTWAGGTGGRDTAGLGGVGGPYRLDAGHDVHQVDDHIKQSVPEHIKEAALEMNRKAYEDRLREIKMSPYDAKLYDYYSSEVSKQVRALKLIITGLQAKAQDRQWLKHQTSGELDDTRLIEGIVGEKNIYKKRADLEPEPGSVQEKPKKLRLVVDVSGSMYRFNGHDKRLERTMEAVLMVMESFNGYESKIVYDIFGHSGEERALPFVKGATNTPTNEKERLSVLKSMSAHSQFCMSGDHTLEATVSAINDLSVEADKYDENIIIVLSDANFDRYGISPKSFAKILNKSNKVSTYAIFIGSLGDQAEKLTKRLPSGKAFVCMDNKKIPEILKTIFTSTMLK